MAVVKMQKVAVVAHRSEKEGVLELLHKEGVMEITDAREATSHDHAEVPYRAAELDHVIAKLQEAASKQTLAACKKKASDDEIRRAALEHDIRGIIDSVHALEQQEGDLQRALHELEHGHVPEKKKGPKGKFDANAADEGVYFTASEVHEDLSRFGQTQLTLGEEVEQVKTEQAKTLKQLETVHGQMAKLSGELPMLVRARKYMRWLDEKATARDAMKHTKTTVTLFGWIAKSFFDPLEKKLHKLSPATALLKVDPRPGEQAPVHLKNPTWLAPFESVTTLYGLPQAHEFDPTPLLAPFFILFFGLCLTDAGYGLVLAALMAVYLAKNKLSVRQAPLWWLLLIGGLMTFLISIPFGGWFGLAPAQVQGFLPSAVVDTNGDGVADLFKGQIWNLGETPGITFFQNLSIALGLIHLSFGIFLAGLSKWVLDRKGEAFWVDWTTLILFAAAGAYFFVPTDQKQNALYAIYFSIALVFWGKGHGSTLAMRPLNGFLGILNLAMGMLSNTLSYLRLLALGLVTGALALAVNLVAQQIGGMLPIYLGIPVAIIIYLSGHTVNIALNVLGAFIHSGRLQFVEFFSQFFEGGGRPFVPFKRSHAS